MAVSGLTAGALAEIFNLLPTIFIVIQAMVYIFAVLFFGSIAVKGYRGFMTRKKNLILRIVLGVICVFTGTSISPFLRIDNPLFKLMQIDLLLGMLVSSVIIMISMKFMTMYIPYSVVIREKIRHLQDKLDKRKDKYAIIPKNHLKKPATIAGLVLFIGLLAFALMNFHGFTDMRSSVFSTLGISESDWSAMSNALSQFANSPIANLSASCMTAIQGTQSKSELWDNPPVYTNDALKAIIEQNSGEAVAEMYKIQSGSIVLISSKGVSGKNCFATQSEFCICA